MENMAEKNVNEPREIQFQGLKLELLLLSLADNVVGPPGTERLYGESTLLAGRMLIRGVPRHLVAAAVSKGLNMPGEDASCFVEQLADMISTCIITDSVGNPVKVRVGSLPGFSLQTDIEEHTSNISGCLGAFVSRNYSACIEFAQKALTRYAQALPFQMLVICLQRLGQKEEAEKEGRRALAALTYAPWHRSLMQVTLGELDAETVHNAATTDGDRCQVRFYQGARALTLHYPSGARQSFDECLCYPTDLIEQTLAIAEMESMGLAVKRSEFRQSGVGAPK